MVIDNSEVIEWRELINDEKTRIRVQMVNRPVELLMEMFYWIRENQDGTNLKEKFPSLYEELDILYISNSKKPLIETLKENLKDLKKLVENFNSNAEELREWDINLYYALLNFINFLKNDEGQRLYYKIMFS